MSFTGFLSQQGASCEPHLRRARLPLLCQDADYLVPHHNVWACFGEMAAAESPDLGWLVGKYVGDSNINRELLSQMEHAPTLYRALNLLFSRLRSEATDIRMGMHELADDVLVFMHYPGRQDDPGCHQAQAYQLGIVLDIIRHFAGRSWNPTAIGIESKNHPTDVKEHFPETRILTQRAFGYIQLPRQLLHRKARSTVNTADMSEGSLDIAERPEFVTALRALLVSYLPDGYLPARRAAELMEVSERTLARRLGAHGLRYGTLVDDVRFSRAGELLKDSELTMLEIANSIGISDQSNFNRLFRRVGGLSPNEYRKHYNG